MNPDTERPDPGMEPIKIICEKIIYDVYLQNQPELVQAIGQLVRKGHSPTMIADRVKSMIPATSQVDDHVFLIASHLLRQ